MALTGFVPVSMATDVAALPPQAPLDTPAPIPIAGHVEVELPNGVNVRVKGDILRLELKPRALAASTFE